MIGINNMQPVQILKCNDETKDFSLYFIRFKPSTPERLYLNNSFVSWGSVCPRIMANELIIYAFDLNKAILQALDIVNYTHLSFDELLEIYRNINYKDIKLVELLQLVIANWEEWN
jgi:hypothetical protein